MVLVSRVESDGEMVSFGKELRKIGRDPRNEQKYRPIVNAPNLSGRGISSLRYSKGLTGEQKKSVKKYLVDARSAYSLTTLRQFM